MRFAEREQTWRREYEAALARIVGGKREPTCREIHRAKIEADARLAKANVSEKQPQFSDKLKPLARATG